jgi:hypothetical protein
LGFLGVPVSARNPLRQRGHRQTNFQVFYFCLAGRADFRLSVELHDFFAVRFFYRCRFRFASSIRNAAFGTLRSSLTALSNRSHPALPGTSTPGIGFIQDHDSAVAADFASSYSPHDRIGGLWLS